MPDSTGKSQDEVTRKNRRIESSIILEEYYDRLLGLPYPVLIKESAIDDTVNFGDGKTERCICIPQLEDLGKALVNSICSVSVGLLLGEVKFLLECSEIPVQECERHLGMELHLTANHSLPEETDRMIRTYIMFRKAGMPGSGILYHENYIWNEPETILRRKNNTSLNIEARLVYPTKSLQTCPVGHWEVTVSFQEDVCLSV